MSELDWKGTSQKAYQDLFNLNSDLFSRPLLVYQGGKSLLSSLPKITCVEESLASPKKTLPFEDFQFDLAISTHQFFNMKEAHEVILHQLKELLRVAREVRLAPHRLESEEVAKQLGPLMLALQQEEVGVEITPLNEEQGCKNAVMIKLWAQSCRVK